MKVFILAILSILLMSVTSTTSNHYSHQVRQSSLKQFDPTQNVFNGISIKSYGNIDIVGKTRNFSNKSPHINVNQWFNAFRSPKKSSLSSNNRSSLLIRKHRSTEHIVDDIVDCGGNITIFISKELSSPNYPNNYPPNIHCLWNVYTATNHVLKVKILHLNIEQDAECRFDYLDIKEQQTVLKYCGTNHEETEFVIETNQTTVLFHSDSTTELDGFRIKITAESRIPNCVPEMFVFNIVNITSPNYPVNYDNSQNCWTRLTTKEDHRLRLHFEDISLEPNSNCLFDFVEIFDESPLNKTLGKFCDNVQLEPIYSTHNSLVVHFESDHSVSNSGYLANVISLRNDVNIRNCIWSTDWTNKTINNPFHPDRYPDNIKCETSISTQNSNEKIVFYFDWFVEFDDDDLSNSFDYNQKYILQASCYTDSLLIYESVNDTHPSNVFCADRPQRFNYVSKGDSIRLVFHSVSHDQKHLDWKDNIHGFRAKFHFVPLDSNSDDLFGNNQRDKSSYSDQIKPTVTQKSENVLVRLGSSHVLFCPLAVSQSISWFKNDHEIHEGLSPDRSSLLIKQFQMDSVGLYRCESGDYFEEIWLNVDTQTSACFNLNLSERPEDQDIIEGEFVMLHCNVSLNSSFEIDIDWEKYPLYNEDTGNQTIQQVYNSRIRKYGTGDLLFNPALFDDSGYYFCVVRVRPKDKRDHKDDPSCVYKLAARVLINRRLEKCGMAPIFKEDVDVGNLGKIIGGTEAKSGEFPFMAMFWDTQRQKSFCGGVLLDDQWVATAVHCFRETIDITKIIVRFGKVNQINLEWTEYNEKIDYVVKHPLFSKQTYDNDIALVKLNNSIEFTNYIMPICIPTSTEEIDEINSQYFFGKEHEKFGYVAGWGRLTEEGPIPEMLHKIRLPIVEQHKCLQSSSYRVTENMFCAGYGRMLIGDSCRGDSGGPFAVLYQSRWTLLGIVSWGEGCSRPEKYGFYTKVTNYINWIQKIINT